MTAMSLLSDSIGFEIPARARRKSNGWGHGATFEPVKNKEDKGISTGRWKRNQGCSSPAALISRY